MDYRDDPRLSFKAKGILCWCLGREFTVEDVVKSSTDGPGSVESGIRELVACGYAEYRSGNVVVREKLSERFAPYTIGADLFGYQPEQVNYLESGYERAHEDFVRLGGKKGAENKLLFKVFWNLFGHQGKDPDYRMIGRLSKIRNGMQDLSIDGLGFLKGLYALHEGDDFCRMDSLSGYMDALPARVLNYLTAKIQNSAKREYTINHTVDSHNAVQALFESRIP